MIERPQRSGSLVQSQGTYLSGYWNGWSFQVGRHKNDHRQRGRNTCYRHPFESVAETNIKANYLCKILLIICIAVCFPFYISAEENTEPGLFSRKISEIFHPKKAAYIKLAKILTKSQLENKSKSDNKDISDIVSYYNSLIM